MLGKDLNTVSQYLEPNTVHAMAQDLLPWATGDHPDTDPETGDHIAQVALEELYDRMHLLDREVLKDRWDFWREVLGALRDKGYGANLRSPFAPTILDYVEE